MKTKLLTLKIILKINSTEIINSLSKREKKKSVETPFSIQDTFWTKTIYFFSEWVVNKNKFNKVYALFLLICAHIFLVANAGR